MEKYKKVKTDLGHDFIVRSNDDTTATWIPIDAANSDYQAYLESLKIAADEAKTK
jgi:hypothetical protein